MTEEKVTPKVDPDADEQIPATEPKPDDGEFKITVRKLELPVRPRGVLAE